MDTLHHTHAQDLIVVAHPDDEVLEFFSILFAEDRRNVSCIVCTEGLSYRTKFLSMLKQDGHIKGLAFGSQPSDLNRQLDRYELNVLLQRHKNPNIKRVWTHNPADSHPHHCQVALAVSEVFHDNEICYSHGISSNEFQFVADYTVSLSSTQIKNKIQIINQEYADQVQYQRRWNSSGLSTQSIVSIEKFVKLSNIEVKQLFALRFSLEKKELPNETFPDYKTAPDGKNLDTVQKWIKSWIHPQMHSLVEVGSRDGTFTEKLYAAGYHKLIACEARTIFKEKLEKKLTSKVQSILDRTLVSLTEPPFVPADYYLLLDINDISDLSPLNKLPTDCLLLLLSDECYQTTFNAWLRSDSHWRIVDETTICSAQVEFCVGEKVFRRQPGYIGIVLYRESLIK